MAIFPILKRILVLDSLRRFEKESQEKQYDEGYSRANVHSFLKQIQVVIDPQSNQKFNNKCFPYFHIDRAPYQPNFNDCGVYCLYFFEKVLEIFKAEKPFRDGNELKRKLNKLFPLQTQNFLQDISDKRKEMEIVLNAKLPPPPAPITINLDQDFQAPPQNPPQGHQYEDDPELGLAIAESLDPKWGDIRKKPRQDIDEFLIKNPETDTQGNPLRRKSITADGNCFWTAIGADRKQCINIFTKLLFQVKDLEELKAHHRKRASSINELFSPQDHESVGNLKLLFISDHESKVKNQSKPFEPLQVFEFILDLSQNYRDSHNYLFVPIIRELPGARKFSLYQFNPEVEREVVDQSFPEGKRAEIVKASLTLLSGKPDPDSIILIFFGNHYDLLEPEKQNIVNPSALPMEIDGTDGEMASDDLVAPDDDEDPILFEAEQTIIDAFFASLKPKKPNWEVLTKTGTQFFKNRNFLRRECLDKGDIDGSCQYLPVTFAIYGFPQGKPKEKKKEKQRQLDQIRNETAGFLDTFLKNGGEAFISGLDLEKYQTQGKLDVKKLASDIINNPKQFGDNLTLAIMGELKKTEFIIWDEEFKRIEFLGSDKNFMHFILLHRKRGGHYQSLGFFNEGTQVITWFDRQVKLHQRVYDHLKSLEDQRRQRQQQQRDANVQELKKFIDENEICILGVDPETALDRAAGELEEAKTQYVFISQLEKALTPKSRDLAKDLGDCYYTRLWSASKLKDWGGEDSNTWEAESFFTKVLEIQKQCGCTRNEAESALEINDDQVDDACGWLKPKKK